MGKLIAATIALVVALAASALLSVDRAAAVGSAAVRPGAPAPGFTAPDIAGRMVNLGQYAGQIVILEWTNNGCPFVQKHYDSANMQTLQRRYTQGGVIWLTIASSAPGEEGYVIAAAGSPTWVRSTTPLRPGWPMSRPPRTISSPPSTRSPPASRSRSPRPAPMAARSSTRRADRGRKPSLILGERCPDAAE